MACRRRAASWSTLRTKRARRRKSSADGWWSRRRSTPAAAAKAAASSSPRPPTRRPRSTKQILGMTLVTHQTGPEGRVVRKVLIEEALNIDKELYLGITLDRALGHERGHGVRTGRHGHRGSRGARPERHSPRADRHRSSAFSLSRRARSRMRSGSRATRTRSASTSCRSSVRAYVETDASLAEINPLLVTKEGDVLALDCKMNFDDNALFRHKDIVEMRDLARRGPARGRGRRSSA